MLFRKFVFSVVLLFGAVGAEATLINFNATGVAGVSGFVQFDDSSFDGDAFQFLSNAAITDLNLLVFGEVYTLADVAIGDDTIIDSSGLVPLIVNGSGNLADNGVQSISFFPDGFDGTASDGDASLGIGPGGEFANDEFFAVQWVAAAAVPEPTTVALMGLGLAGLGYGRKRKSA